MTGPGRDKQHFECEKTEECDFFFALKRSTQASVTGEPPHDECTQNGFFARQIKQLIYTVSDLLKSWQSGEEARRMTISIHQPLASSHK